MARDPTRVVRPWRWAMAAAATATLALALAACGDDGDDSPGQEASAPATSTATAPTDDGAATKQGSKQNGKESGPGEKAKQGSTGQNGGGKEPVDLGSCPEGMSRADCRALIDSAADSKTIGKNQCQSVLSKEQCQALGEALEGQSDGSRELGKKQCYGALTKKQCRELGRALGLG